MNRYELSFDSLKDRIEHFDDLSTEIKKTLEYIYYIGFGDCNYTIMDIVEKNSVKSAVTKLNELSNELNIKLKKIIDEGGFQ